MKKIVLLDMSEGERGWKNLEIHVNEGRKEGRKKKGRKEGRKEGRKKASKKEWQP